MPYEIGHILIITKRIELLKKKKQSLFGRQNKNSHAKLHMRHPEVRAYEEICKRCSLPKQKVPKNPRFLVNSVLAVHFGQLAYQNRGWQPLARVPNLAREHLYSAREQKLENEMLLPSNEKVRNLGVTALYEAGAALGRFDRLLQIGPRIFFQKATKKSNSKFNSKKSLRFFQNKKYKK